MSSLGHLIPFTGARSFRRFARDMFTIPAASTRGEANNPAHSMIRRTNTPPVSAFDRDAFARELSLASRQLWCIAAAILGSPARAEDVLQDAAVTALQKLHEFTPGTSFAQWMGQIVRFTALNHLRRAHRAPTTNAELSLAKASTLNGSTNHQPSTATLQETAFDAAITGALSSLSEEARVCLLMKAVLEMPYSQISLALGIPENTAMSHVHRARALMRQRLSSYSSRGTT